MRRIIQTRFPMKFFFVVILESALVRRYIYLFVSFSLSFFLSFFIYFCLFMCLFIYLFIYVLAGAIAGIVVSCAMFMTAIIIISIVVYRRKRAVTVVRSS